MEWVPYLGSTISEDGDESEEIKRRLAMATNKLSKLKFLWNGQDLHARLRILRTRIFPLATYGCEMWTLGKLGYPSEVYTTKALICTRKRNPKGFWS